MRSIDQLLTFWSGVNSDTRNIVLHSTPGKGNGLFATSRDWRLSVPLDHVLSEETAPGFLTRAEELLFVDHLTGKELTALLTLALEHKGGPYLEAYKDLLPKELDVPTLWKENELDFLLGTSLWDPLQAKLRALRRDFSVGGSGTDLQTFTYADALVRSRSIGIDGRLHIVPLLDMANHSSTPTVRWAVEGRAITLLPTEDFIAAWDNKNPIELEINYGDRSAAEWLYSYGFIPTHYTSEMRFEIEQDPADPLGDVKHKTWGEIPFVTLRELEYDAPFLWLMCLDEDDGLECMPERVSFEGTSVEHDLKDTLIHHDRYPIFHLRVVTVVCTLIEMRLTQMARVAPVTVKVDPWQTRLRLASELFAIEQTHLRKVQAHMYKYIGPLFKDPVVVKYLNSDKCCGHGDRWISTSMVQI